MIEFYAKMLAYFTAEREDEKGATAVEYGLLVALIAAVIIGVVVTLGERVEVGFQKIVDQLPAA